VKCGARVALGVAGGYFLGRTKKMKLALMLAGMSAGRRAGGPGELLKSGTKLLNSSPELAQLTDVVRGRLLEAGKGAALAVATRQVESLTDRVGKRVESLGDLGTPRRGSGDDEPAPADDQDEDRADDRADEDEDAGAVDDAPAEDEPEPEPAAGDADERPARRPARSRTAKATSGGGGKSSSATTTARRAGTAAGGGARAAGKTATGRKPARTRRGEGNG
jgi:hypothetical protein